MNIVLSILLGVILGILVIAYAMGPTVTRMREEHALMREFVERLSNWSWSGDEARMCAIDLLEEMEEKSNE
ncbi:MAG: hypothetical protein V3R57_07730 [Candidatus Bathyarchaeia archaeon]